VKTIHEEVMVCVAHDTENCHECNKTVCVGLMGDQSVSVLRDTGCSTVVLKRESG